MIVECYEDVDEIVINEKVEYSPLLTKGIFGFFVWIFIRKKFRCRSPP